MVGQQVESAGSLYRIDVTGCPSGPSAVHPAALNDVLHFHVEPKRAGTGNAHRVATIEDSHERTTGLLACDGRSGEYCRREARQDLSELR